jgi:DNA-binding NarL/FixJ family response regulator
MRVVVAEDQMLTRTGIVTVLTAAGVEIVGQVGDAEELVKAVALEHPDVAVVDIRLPPTYADEGLRAADRIRSEYPVTAVLILSQYLEAEYVAPLIASGEGHIGYLLKDRVLEENTVVDALHRVVAGESVIDPAVVAALLAPASPAVAGLSQRETEVLGLVAEGLSNAGIAERLVISERTVEVHSQRIFAKLGISDEQQVNRRVASVLAYLGIRA